MPDVQTIGVIGSCFGVTFGTLCYDPLRYLGRSIFPASANSTDSELGLATHEDLVEDVKIRVGVGAESTAYRF